MPPLTLAHGCCCARRGTQLKKKRPQLTLGLVLKPTNYPQGDQRNESSDVGRVPCGVEGSIRLFPLKWHRPLWVTDQRAPPTLPAPLAGRHPPRELGPLNSGEEEIQTPCRHRSCGRHACGPGAGPSGEASAVTQRHTWDTPPAAPRAPACHGLPAWGPRLTCLRSARGGSCASRQPQTRPQCRPG